MRPPLSRALSVLFLATALFNFASTQQPSPAPFTPAQPSNPPTVQNPPAQTQSQVPGSEPVKDANGVYTIRRNARLVVLDLVVTDAKGNIVPDLKRNEFHVTEANEPQNILNFEASGAHTLDPQLTINSTEELDRLAPTPPSTSSSSTSSTPASRTWPSPATPSKSSSSDSPASSTPPPC
ncbi:hypothetical protein [Granulicella sp. L60]|uniref:hypothetical protein n=1 Tax=Granulicella sp. L60 TaxID=1641866 RepID=UPI0020B15C49|nr:hypothetical protein [Granulicella sp. L60]